MMAVSKAVRYSLKFGSLVAVVFALSSCALFTSEADRAFLREKSAEIGGKDALEWNMRMRAVEWLNDACRRKTGPIEKRIDCVKTVLKLLQ